MSMKSHLNIMHVIWFQKENVTLKCLPAYCLSADMTLFIKKYNSNFHKPDLTNHTPETNFIIMIINGGNMPLTKTHLTY